MQPAQIETTPQSKPELLIQRGMPPVQYGYLALIWRRLKRDRAPLGGAVLGLTISLTALFAPPFAPHDPTVQYRDGRTPDGQPIASTLLQGTTRLPLGPD